MGEGAREKLEDLMVVSRPEFVRKSESAVCVSAKPLSSGFLKFRGVFNRSARRRAGAFCF